MSYIFIQYSLQKAREEHTCDLCNKKIKKGEEYLNHYNRDFYAKLHQKCYEKQYKKEIK